MHFEIQPYRTPAFSRISRACEGVVFRRIDIVNELMSKAGASAGLKVFTSVLDQVFENGREAAD